MARVLGIMGSARKDGYTRQVLDRMLEAAGSIPGVQVEAVHLLDYHIGPCHSCYECIRRPDHRCILKDDMGQQGAGPLWKKVEMAQAMVWASPVHGWAADALIHLFIERLYPFLWSGELKGMPVATLAVASNQGFQLVAHQMLCQWAFTNGGLPVHTAYLDEALSEAAYLGRQLGEAALEDQKGGRHALSDEEMWLAYQGKPWAVYPHYVENLTRGAGRAEQSLIHYGLAQGTFKRPEAAALLNQADAAMAEFLRHRDLGEERLALQALVRASALWTHATWSEFLEQDLIKAPPPSAYRPL